MTADDFAALIAATVDIFKIPFTIFGFTISFWQIFLFSAFAGIVAWIIREVFLGD